MENSDTPQRPMTEGEIAVGLKFNPSGDEKAQKLKELFAQAFDIVEQHVSADDGTIQTARKRKMRDAALHEIVSAQMWAVKVVTLDK
jgi:malate synthase